MQKIKIFNHGTEDLIVEKGIENNLSQGQIQEKIEELISDLAVQSGSSYKLTEKNVDIYVEFD